MDQEVELNDRAPFSIKSVPEDLKRRVREAAKRNDERISKWAIRAFENEIERGKSQTLFPPQDDQQGYAAPTGSQATFNDTNSAPILMAAAQVAALIAQANGGKASRTVISHLNALFDDTCREARGMPAKAERKRLVGVKKVLEENRV